MIQIGSITLVYIFTTCMIVVCYNWWMHHQLLEKSMSIAKGVLFIKYIFCKYGPLVLFTSTWSMYKKNIYLSINIWNQCQRRSFCHIVHLSSCKTKIFHRFYNEIVPPKIEQIFLTIIIVYQGQNDKLQILLDEIKEWHLNITCKKMYGQSWIDEVSKTMP